jgi:hypothetical protein
MSNETLKRRKLNPVPDDTILFDDTDKVNSNSNSNSISTQSSTFIPSVGLETLSDLIVIGEEFEEFRKSAREEQDLHVEEMRKQARDCRTKIAEINSGIQRVRNDRKKTLLKKRIVESRLEVEESERLYNEKFIDTDFGRLSNIISELKELNCMIGLTKMKNSIVNQILFFIQKLNSDEMMHTAIFGSPGTGKTVTGRILGKIYTKLGYLTDGTFTIAKRSDMVGKYLGHTAAKTQKLLEASMGGVLFLDEAYSLGNKDQGDSYSKEAIDTINQFLSENSDNFIMIIAGYEKDVKNCFFAYNQGLERRFPWTFKMDSYSRDELKQILEFQIERDGWKLSDDFKEAIELDTSEFKNNGGDTLVLYDKCKFAHSRRVFGKEMSIKKILTKEDFDYGLKMYKDYKNNAKIKESKPPIGMYC